MFNKWGMSMDKFLSLMNDFIEKEKRDFAINELLKIKVEIKEEQKRILTLDNGQYYVALCDFQKLLDNHIEELKGEQE